MKKSQRIPLKGGDEFDALTGWRRFFGPTAGVRARVKKIYNKRFRREAAKDLVERTTEAENTAV